MTLSTLPLGYCTNVHPGRTLAEVDRKLAEFTVPVAANCGRPIAAGLWLARPVVDELLQTDGALARFAGDLRRRGLSCHTLNAFPYGDFHSVRVKENVYVPDWSQPERLGYTQDCARILAALLDDGVEGSISTVPLGFKPFHRAGNFLERCLAQLLALAQFLDRLYAETGRLVRLAIEPEPLCLLETTPEAIQFFEHLHAAAAERHLEGPARTHLGLCYDVCHQAVEFEDVAASIRALDRNGVRINKLHITCALQLQRPSENDAGRRALARYVEPRYLHQTLARTSTGRILRQADLSEELALHPPREFLAAEQWRVHFHVPVDAEQFGPLDTTRGDLNAALRALAELDYAPHLEVETYTWDVLPEGRPARLVDGLTRELAATQKLLDEVAARPCS